MSAKLVRVACSVGRFVRVSVAAGVLVGLLTAVPAAGSAIRPARHVVKAQAIDATQAYFQHALAVHSLHVRVPASLRPLQATNGLLPDTPFVDYLRWRWGLNPVRFARFHPHTAQLLSIDDQLRKTVTQFQLPPPVIPPPINPGGETIIPPPNTPEPATGLIAALMVGAVCWVRRYRHRADRDKPCQDKSVATTHSGFAG